MKRLVIAVVGGVVIPFVYSVIVAPLTALISDNHTLAYFALVPVRWPMLILFWFGPPLVAYEVSEAALLIYVVVCNVTLYTILTYCFLWGFSRRKSNAIVGPPNPPTFVQ